MCSSFSFCEETSHFRTVPVYHIERLIERNTFPGRKMIAAEEDTDAAADVVISGDLNEYCWSLSFEPAFLVRLFYSGFLPICTDLGPLGDPVYCLLPKLHDLRAVIDLNEDRCFSTERKIEKKFRNFSISVDLHFELVLQRCIAQHGDRSWMCRPLKHALVDLHRHGSSSSQVKVHSVEFSDSQGQVVAGEIGYRVGSIFSSMTGFYTKSGAGAAQLRALGLWLHQRGFSTWDLGMDMPYKRDLGAKLMTRSEWISQVRKERVSQPVQDLSGSVVFSSLTAANHH